MTPTESFKFMQRGKADVSRALVFKWHIRFTDGLEDICDQTRLGRPRRSDRDVEEVRRIISENRRRSVREIKEMTGLSRSSVFNILTNDLEMNTLCARWVPRLLRDNEEETRIRLSQSFVDRFESCNVDVVNDVKVPRLFVVVGSRMAALSLGAVVGIVVGGVVLIIFAGAIAVCIVGRGSRKRESKELKEMVIMRKKRSLRRPVWGERFEYSDNYDVKDIPPPRGSNEQQQQYVESFAFDADALTTRQSYDRPYVSSQHQSDPQKTTTVGNYGQVSMISYGGPRIASNRVSSGDLGTLEDSWTQLIPKRKSYLSSRAPAPLPTTKPGILYVHRPPSGHTSHPNTMQDRPDSFRSSFAVDLGAQHQKAWMMSSLEKEKPPYYR